MYQDKRDTQKETRDVVDMVYRVTECGICWPRESSGRSMCVCVYVYVCGKGREGEARGSECEWECECEGECECECEVEESERRERGGVKRCEQRYYIPSRKKRKGAQSVFVEGTV
jgi:hypothetical protein